jgi:Zinc finger, C2H2 type
MSGTGSRKRRSGSAVATNWPCPICNFVGKTKSSLLNHMTIHIFKCPFSPCKFSTDSSSDYVKHINEFHKDRNGSDLQPDPKFAKAMEAYKHPCDFPGCKYETENYDDLFAHRRSKHVPEDYFLEGLKGGRRGRTRKARRANRNLRRSSRGS